MIRRRTTIPILGPAMFTLPQIPVVPTAPPIQRYIEEPREEAKRPRAKARCRVNFDTLCPHCRGDVQYKPHFDSEHDQLKDFLVAFFQVAKGKMTTEEFQQRYPRALRVVTTCHHCNQSFVVNSISL